IYTLLASPITTDSQIQQPMKLLIKRPHLISFALIREIEQLNIIYKATDILGCPIYAEGMKLGRGMLYFSKSGLLGTDGMIIIFGMHTDVHDIPIIPDMFENINLSRRRPISISPIARQHPSSRPGSTALRHFGFHFKPTVQKIAFSFTYQACGRVFAAFICFFTSGNG